MQTASSRIWSRVTDSISFDDNRYSKFAFLWIIKNIYVYRCKCDCKYICPFMIIYEVGWRGLDIIWQTIKENLTEYTQIDTFFCCN